MNVLYGSIESANRQARQRVKDYRHAAGFIPAIITVIKDFDGKAYNCRFDNAIQAATGNSVYVDKTEYVFTIYTHAKYDYGFHITMACIKTSELTDGKRIPAGLLISSAQEYHKEILQTAEDLENMIKKIPLVKEKISRSVGKLNAYLQSLPNDIRTIYGIPYAVRLS